MEILSRIAFVTTHPKAMRFFINYRLYHGAGLKHSSCFYYSCLSIKTMVISLKRYKA